MTSKLSTVQWRPPSLKTQRLILRGWEPADAEAVYEYASDRETTEFMAWDCHTSIAEAHFFLNEIVAPQYADENFTYALCLTEAPEQVIGGVGVVWNPREEGVLELGYVLHRDHWGKGLMPEACRELIRCVWEATDATRIFAPIMSENSKSRRLAEKLGMHLDGILRSHMERRGKRRDMAIYSLLRGVDSP